MAWSTPMTAVANSPMTASLYNTQVRDNLNVQAPALAGTAGKVFVTTGANTLTPVGIQFDEVTTSQTTTSSTYADLATVGPQITVSGIYGQQAMVWISAEMDQNTANLQASASVEVTGSSSYPASDTRCATTRDGMAANCPVQFFGAFLFDPLTSDGSVTFTMKYRNGGAGTCTFKNRRMMVWPL